MISYRDMTFCPFHDECTLGPQCPRALTDEVRKGAKSIGLPIAMFMERPNCFKEVKKKDE